MRICPRTPYRSSLYPARSATKREGTHWDYACPRCARRWREATRPRAPRHTRRTPLDEWIYARFTSEDDRGRRRGKYASEGIASVSPSHPPDDQTDPLPHHLPPYEARWYLASLPEEHEESIERRHRESSRESRHPAASSRLILGCPVCRFVNGTGNRNVGLPFPLGKERRARRGVAGLSPS
jgi:hypothetical protein